MRVKLIVKDVARLRGIENARRLAALAGIPPSVAYGYWDDKVENFSRTTLGKIADVLDVEPGMLIVRARVPSGASSTPSANRAGIGGARKERNT